MSNKRLWLIDASYLFNAQKSFRQGYNFDYRKLRIKLEEDEPIWRAYFLNAVRNNQDVKQNHFHNWLRSAKPRGPQIITKLYNLKSEQVNILFCSNCNEKVDVYCPNCADYNHSLVRAQQKGVDVGLATLALTLINQYDTLLLSSGDGDLLDSIDYIVNRGKGFELAVFNTNNVSTELQSHADRIYWIDEFADEVERDQNEH